MTHTHYCPCTPGRLWPTAHTHTTPTLTNTVSNRGDDDPAHVAYVIRTFNEDGTRK